LFGDGAGAFVLQASDQPGGVLSSVMRADGSGGDLLWVPAGGSKRPTDEQTVQEKLHYIQMNGREVFRFATRVMAQATREAVKLADFELEEIDLIIPHQANQRIIETAARGLKLPLDRFFINLDRYGNTSTASIPLATFEALEEDRIQPGDKIIFVGFGAGLTWGALAAQWTGPLSEPEFSKVWPYRFKKLYRVYARVRSAALRIMRAIEGFIWGRTE
jgi:3-oxoacyl-[acyl-carrier-protein] synthase-3